MTPAEKLGYKVGDEFEVLTDVCGFKKGQIVKLFEDDGSGCVCFEGSPCGFECADGKPGAYLCLYLVKPVERITLEPVDYIATADLIEDDYHKVAKAFMAAGAFDRGDAGWEKNEYQKDSRKLGWDCRDNELWSSASQVDGFTRQLTLSQILSATNAGGDARPETKTEEEKVKEFKVGDKVVLNGHRNDGDDFHNGITDGILGWVKEKTVLTVTKECSPRKGSYACSDGKSTWDIHNSEMEHFSAAEYSDEPMHLTDRLEAAIRAQSDANAEVERLQAEWRGAYPNISGCVDIDVDDIKPEEWKAGDIFECTTESRDNFTKGKHYVMEGRDIDNDPTFTNDLGQPNQFIRTRSVKFIRRP